MGLEICGGESFEQGISGIPMRERKFFCEFPRLPVS